jgi:hypothetical protein
VARSVAERVSPTQRAVKGGSARELHHENNITLYSELIVYKCGINNHNTTLQVI